MKCEKCNKEGLKYLVPKPKFSSSTERKNAKWIRTKFKARCNKCNWEGNL